MSDFKQGTFDADKFQDIFGLSTVDESEAYTEGSGTGSKQTGALGTYMSKGDYDRLKDSDQVWDAYAALNGDEAMEKKREGGSMSLNTLDALMDDLSVAKQGEEGEKKTLDDFQDIDKDEDFLKAEDAYQENFKNGNPWAATSAVDSYQTAFNNAAGAGRKMTANDYLMQRADDKKGGVNRFIGYLGDKNTLANEEQNYAFSNLMAKAKHLDFQGPPELDDPYDTYSKYKNDIDSIGD